tara:strand:- start:790 stop:1164 length:375 start_codon:yes stop_codon:yes gene_type:complete
MLNKILKLTILLFTILAIASLVSCEKEKETIGIVVVKKIDGSVFPQATVTLHQDGLISQQGQPVSDEIRASATTDENGRAQFVYENEAILNVEVVAVEGNDQLIGASIIRLLRGKTVTIVVEVS